MDVGNGILVGGGRLFTSENFYDGPTQIVMDKCLFPWNEQNHYVDNCMYLVNNSATFDWVDSANGKYIENMVRFETVPVGKVMHDGYWHVGKILSCDGLIYWSDDIKEFSSNVYKALIFIP